MEHIYVEIILEFENVSWINFINNICWSESRAAKNLFLTMLLLLIQIWRGMQLLGFFSYNFCWNCVIRNCYRLTKLFYICESICKSRNTILGSQLTLISF